MEIRTTAHRMQGAPPSPTRPAGSEGAVGAVGAERSGAGGGKSKRLNGSLRPGLSPTWKYAISSHAMRIDGYSGDYRPGFFGHAVNTGTYITRDPELGWLAFGGNLSVDGASIRVEPLDAARSRVYIAPLGLWLTLDAGTFERVEINENSRSLPHSKRRPALTT